MDFDPPPPPTAPTPPTRLYASSPWPPPSPSQYPTPTPPGPPPRRTGRRALVAVVAVVLALVVAFTGYAVTSQNDSPSASVTDRPGGAPVTTPAPSPASRAPSAASPAPTTPSSGAPSTGSSSSGASGTSQDALSVGVVDVNTRLGFQNAAAAGTGIILNANGEVLTNNHVIDGATSISVTVVSTGKTYTATVVGSDASDDVAVLQLKNASGLKPANLGDSSSVKVGDPITAVGNAGGDGGAPSVVQGQVTGLDQAITATDAGGANAERLTGLIEMNAQLQPGDSGGPLYNANGQVIGMNTAASANRRFRVGNGAIDAYAIPLAKAMTIVHQIEAGQASDTVTIGIPGFLGVEIDSANANGGAVISDIVSGTPAEKIGLQAGDTITAVDGKTIGTPDDLSAILHTRHPGDQVSVTWTAQDGSSHTAKATLATGPVA